MSHSTTLKIQAELVEKYREEMAVRESPAPARGIRKEEKEGDGAFPRKPSRDGQKMSAVAFMMRWKPCASLCLAFAERAPWRPTPSKRPR